MPRWIGRVLRLPEPKPVEHANEASAAREEAAERRKAVDDVLRTREHVIVVNHIAADIAAAYALTRRRNQ